MGMKCGIVGLPNVGKSTLFNAMTKSSIAESANYPFCTIEPNAANVPLHDPRLNILAQIAGSAELIPTYLEMVDIAGLVKGASKGEGLGNKFLSHIREVDAIVHLVRAFEDENITHVESSINPRHDVDIINTELLLADIEAIESRIEKNARKLKAKDKDAAEAQAVMEAVQKALNSGKPARTLLTGLSKPEVVILHNLQLITSKPVIYVANVSEEDAVNGSSLSNIVQEIAHEEAAMFLFVSAKIEADISQLSHEDAAEMLAMIGLETSGLNKITQAGMQALGLATYFTIGPKEARAWTFKSGITAPEAAGIIHTDFEKGFIKAEVISYNDYVTYDGESGARLDGKLRLEGRDYVVKDGDVVHFKFNV